MSKADETPADGLMFEDSAQMPRGRRARTVSEALKIALEDSAKRGVAKVITGAETLIETVTADLSSAWVRKRYTVTRESEPLPGNRAKLTFAAVAKETE
jgi:hypothetical protein